MNVLENKQAALSPAEQDTGFNARQAANAWRALRSRIEETVSPTALWQLIEKSVDEHGDKPAWNFFQTGRRLSYKEAGHLIARSANLLRDLGLKQGDRVATMLGNSPEYLGIWLGSSYLGTILCPINTRYTATELAYALTLATPRLLVIDEEYREILDQVALDRADLLPELIFFADPHGDSQWSKRLASCPSHAKPAPKVDGQSEMNIQFTSGTTGFPKGCILSQSYWVYAAETWYAYVNYQVERSLCNQMLFYVDGQFNAINAFRAGAEFFCVSKPSASRFTEWVKEYRINSVYYFDAMLRVPPGCSDSDNDLRIITTFGFNPNHQQALQKRFNAPVRDSYGMSELAPALIVPLQAETMVGSGTCGLPAPFVETRIIDEFGVDVPVGQQGELLLKSPAMLRGYWNDMEATRQKLKGGWLHTGDLAYKDENGFHFIVGRLKDMIRHNGENVACAEVEAAMRSHSAVAEAAAVPVPDVYVGEEVKVYLLLDAGTAVSCEELIEYAQSQLAPFKVPRFIEFVDEFPMTESHRIQKKKLIADRADLTIGSWDSRSREWKH